MTVDIILDMSELIYPFFKKKWATFPEKYGDDFFPSSYFKNKDIDATQYYDKPLRGEVVRTEPESSRIILKNISVYCNFEGAYNIISDIEKKQLVYFLKYQVVDSPRHIQVNSRRALYTTGQTDKTVSTKIIGETQRRKMTDNLEPIELEKRFEQVQSILPTRISKNTETHIVNKLSRRHEENIVEGLVKIDDNLTPWEIQLVIRSLYKVGEYVKRTSGSTFYLLPHKHTTKYLEMKRDRISTDDITTWNEYETIQSVQGNDEIYDLLEHNNFRVCSINTYYYTHPNLQLEITRIPKLINTYRLLTNNGSVNTKVKTNSLIHKVESLSNARLFSQDEFEVV